MIDSGVGEKEGTEEWKYGDVDWTAFSAAVSFTNF